MTAIGIGISPVFGSAAGAGGAAYSQTVIDTSPIAYWPLWDEPGSLTAVDLMELGDATLGTGAAAPTLGVEGIGDGNTACSFDGDDKITIYTAAFNAAFNGAVGTIAVWAKVANAGVWTDNTLRRPFYIRADASNLVLLQKSTTDNSLTINYIAGGTSESAAALFSSTEWFHFAMTWDKNAGADGEVKLYVNGAQEGTTQTSLGTWVGDLSTTLCTLGAAGTTAPWLGSLAHAAVWDRALTAEEVLTVAANP